VAPLGERFGEFACIGGTVVPTLPTTMRAARLATTPLDQREAAGESRDDGVAGAADVINLALRRAADAPRRPLDRDVVLDVSVMVVGERTAGGSAGR
jgi:hypothetical protein